MPEAAVPKGLPPDSSLCGIRRKPPFGKQRPMTNLEQSVARAWPGAALPNMPVLVAVSGGADSVALLRALHRLGTGAGERLAVAHFHHGLRGHAADRDRDFVRQLADALGLACHVGEARATRSASAGGNFESPGDRQPGHRTTSPGVGEAKWTGGGPAASRNQPRAGRTPAAQSGEPRRDEGSLRAARYQFLRQTAERIGARYVAVAHTVDDQVETILHRILRGTGVTGLAGIPRLRLLSPAVTLIRPLLDVARHDVLRYLEELGQTYRHDASNDDANYTRNRIRQQLLPLLRREYNGQIDEALLRLGSVAQESDEVLRQAAADLLARGLLTQGPAGVCLDVRLLRESPPALARRALALIWQRQGWPERAMSFHQWKRVLALLDGPDLQIILPGAIAASKTETALHLRVQSG